MTSGQAPNSRLSSRGPEPSPARRGLATSFFVAIMVLACLVALAATTLFLIGTNVSGIFPTPVP